MTQKYIGLFGLEPGHVIKTKYNVWFRNGDGNKKTSPVDGQRFPKDTCFIVLDLTEPTTTHDGKERKITVFHENKIWSKWVSHGSFPLMFEVIAL